MRLGNKVVTTNGSPAQRHSIAVGATSVELALENDTALIPLAFSATTLPPDTNSIPKIPEIKEEKEELIAEPLERILENKLVKEKKLELDKKLETLRKKHEKKKMALNPQKSSDFSEKKSKLVNMKLVKRLSSKSM